MQQALLKAGLVDEYQVWQTENPIKPEPQESPYSDLYVPVSNPTPGQRYNLTVMLLAMGMAPSEPK